MQFNDYVFNVVGNNAPLLIAADSQTTDEDTLLTFSLSAFDFDGDAVTASIVAASGASVSEASSSPFTTNIGSGTELAFSYDPGSLYQHLAVGETATDQVTIEVSDGNGGVSTKIIDITVTGVNDAPNGTATASLPNGTEDTPYIVSAADLLAGFSDIDASDTLSIAGLIASDGTVTDNLNGTFTITPTQDFNGPVTLNYNVIDGNGGSIAATQSYILDAVDDATGNNNLGFELGDFTSWQTLGAVFIQTGGAPEGNYMAHLDSYGAWESDIESFLGAGSSALDTIVSGPTNGAAIKTTLSLNAGDTVSFDWYFDGGDYLPFNDTSFFTSLNGNLTPLSNIAAVGDFGDSGWQKTTFTATSSGIYDIGFGVVNSLDTGFNSSLYVDDIAITKYNMDFEAGDFTNWQVLGSANIVTGAPQGNYMAHLDSSGAWESDIESFLGVGSSALDNIVSGPTNGAAIKTTLSLNAGDTVSFDWYFDGGDYLPFNDTSFFTSLNGNLTPLSDIATVGDFGDSGWHTSSFTVALTGVYDFGFGVVNSLDTGFNSNLYVDNIIIS